MHYVTEKEKGKIERDFRAQYIVLILIRVN